MEEPHAEHHQYKYLGTGGCVISLRNILTRVKSIGNKSFRENFRHEGTGVDMWVRGTQIL